MPFCAYHPKRETTGVFCAKCEKPLCPDCVRHGPGGAARCRDCLRLPAEARGGPKPRQLAAGIAAGLGAALAGAAFLGLVYWRDWIVAFLYGLGVGSAVFYAARRHRGPMLQAAAVLFAVIGVLATPVFEWLFHGGGIGIWKWLFRAFVFRSEGLILRAALAALGAIVRFRW